MNNKGFSKIIVVIVVIIVLAAVVSFVWLIMKKPASAPPTPASVLPAPTAGAPPVNTPKSATFINVAEEKKNGTTVDLPLFVAVSVPGTPLRITALDMIDSRCPSGAKCANPGEVVVKMTVEDKNAGAKQNLNLGTVNMKSATVMGYKLELISVDIRSQIARLNVL